MRKDLIYHEIAQNTPEWDALRRGRITSSKASVLLTNGKKKGLGSGAWTLIYKLAGEIVTGSEDYQWTRPEAERGHDLEPVAIEAYAEQTWYDVNQIGFIEWGQYAGTSPDCLVTSEEGHGAEIKCLMHGEHMRVVDNGPGNDYFGQIQWHLFVTGFAQWDLVHFHPRAGKKRLIIHEFKPDQKAQDRYAEAFEAAKNEIERLVSMCVEKEMV